MKVILSGATGFIGGGVLKRLLAVPSITSIIALSRRPLDVSDAKLQVITLKDFLHYDDETLSHLKGTEACIWCLGSPRDGKEVHLDYTMAAANTFGNKLLGNGGKMRFVSLSGSMVESDQNKSLWFLGGTRKMRGQVEIQMLDFQNKHPSQWQSIIARPALVTSGEPFYRFAVPGHYIPLEELAAALVDVALKGSETERLENATLRQRGKAALASKF